jgi:hypothetical protein
MAVYRQIHTTFWQDPEMIEYDPEERYFYIYLMTNPHTRQCGIYEISKKIMAVELGYSIDTVSILLQKFIDRKKIFYSENTKEIYMTNWLKYNSLKSPKVMSCVNNELQTVKNKGFLKIFKDACIQYGYSIDRLLIDYGEEKEKEKEKEKEEEEEYTMSDSENPTLPDEPPENINDSKKQQQKDKHEIIFEYWNNKQIIQHRKLTDKLIRALNGALNDYSEKEICTAIDNYAEILAEEKYYWSYKWGLKDFLSRGLEKFLDFEIAAKNYLTDKKIRDGPINEPKSWETLRRLYTKYEAEERSGSP